MLRAFTRDVHKKASNKKTSTVINNVILCYQKLMCKNKNMACHWDITL